MAAVGWQNGTSGNWTDATGWTSQALPGPNDDVTIEAAGSYTVTLNTAVAIGSLIVGPASPASGTPTLALTGTLASLGVTFDLANAGTLSVDNGGSADGGSLILIGGTFDNSGTAVLGPSDGSLGAGASIEAGALVNSGDLLLYGGVGSADANEAALLVLDSAPEILTGSYDLIGTAMLSFLDGGITAIAPGALVVEHGASADVADGTTADANSALTTLASLAGELNLDGGASLATGGNLAVSGTLLIDDQSGSGASGVSVAGTLTNSGTLQLGPSDFSLSASDMVSAAGFINTGSVVLTGGTGTNPPAALLTIAAAAPSLLTGGYDLAGNASVRFTGGLITGIAGGASLRESGTLAVMALASAPASNAALLALAAVAGTLDLQGGASLALGGALAVTGTVALDATSGLFGSSLRLDGTLTNSGVVSVGASDLSLGGNDTIAVGGLVNTGAIALFGGDGASAARAVLTDLGPAPGTLTGSTDLEGAALLQFASGSITSIASGAALREGDADALVARGDTPTANSALTTLASIAGELDLDDGAAVATTGDLAVTGTLRLDDRSGDGGSAVGVAGTLTNSGGIFVGPADLTLSSRAAITVAHFVNTGGVMLDGGNGAGQPQASLVVGDAAPATLVGNISLSGNALLKFASGAITGIAGGASLAESGAASRVDAGGTTTANNALTGLASIAGELDLENGASLTTRGDLAVTGRLLLDSADGSAFAALGIGGTLTNSGAVFIGPDTTARGGTASAAALVNTGQIVLRGGSATRATLTILGAAPASLVGTYLLFNNSAAQFANGGIGTIAADGFLGEQSGTAAMALASAPTSNSALAGLADVAGELDLVNGASVSTAGDLRVTGAIAIDEVRAAGGSGLSIAGTLSNAGTILLGAGDGSLAFGDVLAASDLLNTGTIALNGGGAATALTTISGTADNAGTLVIGTGATLEMSGPGGLTQTGGLTTLAGTLAGALALTGGLLEGTGDVAGAVTNAGGTLLAGMSATQTGTIGLSGGYTQGAAGVLQIGLGGSAAGAYGALDVTGGAVSLQGGTLDITTVNGFTLAAGARFPVLSVTPGALSGTFSALDFNGVLSPIGTSMGIGDLLKLDVIYDNTDGDVLVAVDSAAPPAQARVAPGTITVGALHVGASVTQAVTVDNSATAPAQYLDARVGALTGAATASGQASLVAAGASNSTAIAAGVTAATDGAVSGAVTVALASDPGDGEVPSVLPSQTINVQGTAYTEAVPSLAPPAPMIAHAGDQGTIALTMSNAAAADGYAENLTAALASVSGGFSVSGAATGEIAAGGVASGTLSVSYAAQQAGEISGIATIDLASDGGTGPNSIDGLGTTTLAPLIVPLEVIVDNPALPAFETNSGDGTITGGLGASTLDLGTIDQGSGPLAIRIGILNAASGPADLLSGSLSATGAFTTGGLAAFSGLQAGQDDVAPTLTLDTSNAGTFTETVTLTSTGSNASGSAATLPGATLTVIATVAPSVAGAGSGSVSGAGSGGGSVSVGGGLGSVTTAAGGSATVGTPGPGAVSILGPNGTVEYVSLGSSGVSTLAAALLAGLDPTQTTFVNAAGTVTIPANQTGAVIAAAGAVTLTGNGAFNQVVVAGAGALNFTAGSGGSGTVVAGSGNDLIYDPASGGNWLMALGDGIDTVVATGGNDSIATGAGGSLVFLGAGASSVSSSGADTVIGGAGGATIAPSTNNALVFALAGPLVFVGGGGASTVVAGAVPATLFGGGSGGSLVFGDGATNYTGSGATDTVVGLAGSMTVQGGAGGGLYFGGTAGNNIITAGSGNTTAFGGGVGDMLTATGSASDLFAGGVGAETLSGAGSSGTNTFFAGFGPETLVGGAGQTALVAGAGADSLAGGSGLTLFLFVNGRTSGAADTIAGWNPTHDFVKLAGYAGGESAVVGAATVANGSATIALSDGTHITFAGVTSLNASSFT